MDAGTGKNAALTVAVNPGSLEAGVHTGEVVLQYGDVTLTIPVELTIDAQVDYDLSYTGLTFRAAVATAALPQEVVLLNRSAKPLGWTAAASVSWLRVDPAAGTTVLSSPLSVSVDTQSLQPGTYSGKVVVTPEGGGAGARTGGGTASHRWECAAGGGAERAGLPG